MSDIINVSLENGDNVQLKKDFLGYRVVEKPTKWYHWILGSRRNAVTLIVLLLILAAFYIGVKYELLSAYQNIMNDPYTYCVDYLKTKIIN